MDLAIQRHVCLALRTLHAAFDNGVIHFVRTEKCLKHRRKRHTARGTEV